MLIHCVDWVWALKSQCTGCSILVSDNRSSRACDFLFGVGALSFFQFFCTVVWCCRMIRHPASKNQCQLSLKVLFWRIWYTCRNEGWLKKAACGLSFTWWFQVVNADVLISSLILIIHTVWFSQYSALYTYCEGFCERTLCHMKYWHHCIREMM